MPSESLNLQAEQFRSVIRQARVTFQGLRERRLGLRGGLLYAFSAPLALASLIALASGNVTTAISGAAAFGLLALGARLNRRGMLEKLVTSERRYTRPIHVPFQYLAVLLVACGTALAAMIVVGHSPLGSVLFGLLSAVGFHLAYRLPPIGAIKGAFRVVVKDPNARQALQEAERQLLGLERAAVQIGNRELGERLHRIAEQGGAVLDMLVRRPRDLFGARQFLHVYLAGAERVASRYARTHRLVRSGVLETNFRNVLVQIESAFEEQRERLVKDEVLDLDVQIDVLRKQLKREGIE